MHDLCAIAHVYQAVSGQGSVQAIDYSHPGGATYNPAKPNRFDYRADVWNAIRKSFPVRRDQLLFLAIIETANWQEEWESEDGKTRTKNTPDRAVAAFNKLWGTRWLYWVEKFTTTCRNRKIAPTAVYFGSVRIGTHKMNESQAYEADQAQFRYYCRHKLAMRGDQPWQFVHGRGQQPLVTEAEAKAKNNPVMPTPIDAGTFDCGQFGQFTEQQLTAAVDCGTF